MEMKIVAFTEPLRGNHLLMKNETIKPLIISCITGKENNVKFSKQGLALNLIFKTTSTFTNLKIQEFKL